MATKSTTKKTSTRTRKTPVRASGSKKTTQSRNVSGLIATVGRRKTSVARVRLTTGGKGVITVNGKTMEQYFPDEFWQMTVTSPLTLVGQRKNVDISVLTNGGGVNGQAEAVRHGIARALQKMDPDMRSTLKKAGFLRRDPREKERKKYGLKRARRAPQFSKR